MGSLKVVADAAGNLVKTIDYDSFGNVLSEDWPWLFIPIGFAGGLRDQDTGFVRLGRRDNDPDIGRFVAQDPMGDTGGDHDPYEYCVDDPVNAVDPRGLKKEKVRQGVDVEEDSTGIVTLVSQAVEGGKDMLSAYRDMIEVNTIGADKYFHCRGNCDAASRGPGGKKAAEVISYLREVYGGIKGDPAADSEADMEANEHGRSSSGQVCKDACSKYRPQALDKRW